MRDDMSNRYSAHSHSKYTYGVREVIQQMAGQEGFYELSLLSATGSAEYIERSLHCALCQLYWADP